MKHTELAVLPERGGVHTGRSPPEEEQSFHSVRVPATCGGTKTTHPPRGRLVEKRVEKTRPATEQRHKAPLGRSRSRSRTCGGHRQQQQQKQNQEQEQEQEQKLKQRQSSQCDKGRIKTVQREKKEDQKLRQKQKHQHSQVQEQKQGRAEFAYFGRKLN